MSELGAKIEIVRFHSSKGISTNLNLKKSETLGDII